MTTSPSSSLPPLGYVGVEVHFTRTAGDGANPKTWLFPLLREEAAGTTLNDLINTSPYSSDFLDKIVAAAQRLVDQGCVGIITDCGFLAKMQRELAEKIDVPVAASALCQLPSILGWVPPSKSVGVVTFDGKTLGDEHLRGAGVREEDLRRVFITGAPLGGLLRSTVDEGRREFDHYGIESEMVRCVQELVKGKPGISAVLLECTQMAPFADAIQKAVRLPVYDIHTLGCWFYQGLVNTRPACWGPVDGSGPYT